jgi:predicted N-acetyltransferase YhbS
MNRRTIRPAEPTLRFATREDIPAVADLLPELAGPHFAERFPSRTAREFFDWKYHQNPSGEAIVGIAESSGRLVATVAAAPTQLQLSNRLVTAYNLGDFLTTPEFRNRGVFSCLVSAVCDEAAARGAAVVYVQPNEQSYPILVRRSFQEPHQFMLRYCVIPSRALARKLRLPLALTTCLRLDAFALRLSLPRQQDRSLVVEPAAGFDPCIDQFWESARRGYRFLIARDHARLKWRFTDCPTPYRIFLARRGGDLAGYITTFVSHATSTAFVVDLFTRADDRAAAVELLRVGLEDLSRQPVHAIHTWTIDSSRPCMIDDQLRRACRLKWASMHFALRFLGPAPPADLPKEGWHLMAGDFDGI